MAVQRRPPLRAALDRVKLPSILASRLKASGIAVKDRPAEERVRLRRPTLRVPSVDELKLRASQVTPETLITVVIVAAAMLFVFLQLQPNLLFADTTPSGGDMGAHVWGPDYMRHHLLPNLRLTGWAPDWYSGFPAYHFYFPLPSLAIALLSFVLPYGVAFKLITVSGLVTLPLCAYAFGRLAGMRFPGPVMLALATLPFLFDRGFTIYGGNIPSTLAGEFSFSISLSFALLFLGVVARGLDTGRNRALGAVLLALTGLSHLLPTIFAVVGALLLYLLRPGRARLKFLFGLVGVGALLAAFWSFPFGMRLGYANNMGWEKITQYSQNLFPENKAWLWLVLAPAGVVFAVALRRRVGLFLVGMAAITGSLFVLAPAGRLWNARVLPFWFLSLYLLAGVAVTEIGPALGRIFAADPGEPPTRVTSADPVRMQLLARRITPIAAALAVWMFVGLPLGVLPRWLPKPATTDSSYVDDWAKWNYSGYERKESYPEYKRVVDMMASIGTHQRLRSHPLGVRLPPRPLRHPDGPDAPALLDRRLHRVDGGPLLRVVGHGAVPLHDRGRAVEGTVEPPARPALHRPRRVQGRRAPADAGRPLLPGLLARGGGPGRRQPQPHPGRPDGRLAGLRGQGLGDRLAPHQPAGGDHRRGQGRAGVDGGHVRLVPGLRRPRRVPGRVRAQGVAAGRGQQGRHRLRRRSGSDVEVETAQRRPLDPVVVSGIKTSDNRITFDVDRVGVPVLVKASYFPNWKVSGGHGPYRVSPNMMVVSPHPST